MNMVNDQSDEYHHEAANVSMEKVVCLSQSTT